MPESTLFLLATCQTPVSERSLNLHRHTGVNLNPHRSGQSIPYSLSHVCVSYSFCTGGFKLLSQAVSCFETDSAWSISCTYCFSEI